MVKNKVDLTLIKRLLGELETSITAAENISTEADKNKIEYTVELSKAIGLATGMMSESLLLMGDIQSLLHSTGAPPLPKSDFLEKIMGSLKGGGGTN